MKLIHKATGTVIEVPCLIQGGEWEAVKEKAAPTAKKKAAKKTTKKTVKDK